MPRLRADGAVIHPDCEITDCEFGAFTEIGRGSRLAHVAMGDYSYCDRVCDLANAEIGQRNGWFLRRAKIAGRAQPRHEALLRSVGVDPLATFARCSQVLSTSGT